MAYLARKPVKRAVSRTTTMAAPVGGWNARDALSAMAPEDAVTMQNWFPSTSDVQLRQGRTVWCTGLGAQVETLMDCVSPTAEAFWAVAGTTLWDVSTTGAATAFATAPVPTLTNARWQYVNMVSSGGVYATLAVNGTDKMIGYNGTRWNQDGDASALYDVTGVNTANCIQINVHKFRVWLIQSGTLDAWYLPTGAIKGAATKFSLNGTARSGGYLVAMATWTVDAGYGVDDHAVFITSKGEVIVYSGTDPAAASTWQLVGVWQIGSPIGRRCFVKWAGDLLLITHDGLVPMSGALQSSRTNPKVALTDKIQFAVSTAVADYDANFGWEIQPFPRENMVLLNVPVNEGSNQQQYVMNSITKSWCKFSGWDANCFELYSDDLYQGGDGIVYRSWDGNADQYYSGGTTLGANIVGDLQQAFSYMKGPTQLKRFTLMRPVFSSTVVNPPVLAGLNIDYDTSSPTSGLTGAVSASTSDWDTSPWDTTPWAGGLNIARFWQGATGLGYAASPHYVVSTHGIDIRLMATDIVYEIGGIL